MTSDQRQDADEVYEDGAQGVSPKLIAGGIAVLLLVGFFLQNLQDVEINLLWFTWTTSLIWALLLSALVGALAAFLFSTARARGARKREELRIAAAIERRKK